MRDTVIVIGDDKKRSWGTVLIVVGVAVVIALLALLFYHPTGAAYLVITIYNPSNQSTANPHVQPITMSCSFLQTLWEETYGYAPICQDIAYNVTFIEGNQVLPAYPIVSGDKITWWVRMPAIPAGSSVNVTMVLGRPESITNPANVFLVYGDITAFQPGYIYVLDTLSGVTTIYNPGGVGPYIYVANGSTWLFTPNVNASINGFNASYVGTGYLDVAVTPSGQYLIGTAQYMGAPLNTTYQPTNLTGTYAIEYTPQYVLDELAGLGAAYVTSFVNPPPWNGSLPWVSMHPYFIQLPTCYISHNPYGGPTGIYGLLGCLAIPHGGLWIVIKFYEPPGGQGVLISFQGTPYPYYPGGFTPLIYFGLNGSLFVGDWGTGQIVYPPSPGWHVLVLGEYYLNGTYYVVSYLDNASSVRITHTTVLPQLFGSNSPGYPYDYVGTGFTAGGWLSIEQLVWFFFTGVIDYVALYPGGANLSNYLVSRAFSIANQVSGYVPGFAIDYPPNGIEPIITIAYVKTPTKTYVLTPSQMGVVNYAIRIAGS